MRTTLLIILSTLLFAGCGGGGNDGGHSKGGTKEATMETGKSYTIYKGDRIIKSSSEKTVIHVTHIDGHEESTVTLVSGSATIHYQ
jgi:uncharacterized lipoprotein YehR (DUF1307 family)